MASDIVPIQLSLTEGDVVTLWAPRWREDGEEWEAFLGDDDTLFGFPEVTQLAAFVRTATEHDLVDHPAWSVVNTLTVAELIPQDTARYDIVGVPEIAAEDLDTWTVGELAEITEMVRSIADVCELDVVIEVLDSTPGFALLRRGTLPFVGREGARLWSGMVDVIAERWDDVIDALDDLIDTPDVDPSALAAAEKEMAAAELADGVPALVDDADLDLDDAELDDDADGPAAADAVPRSTAAAAGGVLATDTSATDTATTTTDTAAPDPDAPDPDAPIGFWEDVGIDPIRITTRDGEFVTLRCYVDDKPVFLGSGGTVEVFGSERALARWIGEDGAEGHDLVAVSTWPEVVERAAVGELDVEVDDLNAYVLTGLDRDIAEGVLAVDASQLELATELLLDVGEWAADSEPAEALAESQPLGWLVSFVIRPDPTRLAPGPPFDAEAAKWRELTEELQDRLHQN